MKLFTQFKLFTLPSTSKGFTLIELIIGGAVSLVVISVTLGLLVEQRRLFLGDQQKIDYNQNLRAASDFIGTDIKQVGERIKPITPSPPLHPLPVIRLISGGNSGNPDALILQRQLLEATLEICTDISTDDSEIIIADSSRACNFSDGNNDILTDSLGQFKEYRCKLETKAACDRGDDDNSSDPAIDPAITDIDDCDNECVFAYIHDPVNNRGEFFLYTDEIYIDNAGETTNKLQAIPLADGGAFEFDYAISDNPIIYILEEKKYGICEGVLQLTTNRRPDYGDDCPYPDSSPQPVRLVDGIDNFQVRVTTKTEVKTSLNEDLANITDFLEVQSIEVIFETEASDRIVTDSNTLTLSTKFFPRNTKSR